jgi:hypothetical protein
MSEKTWSKINDKKYSIRINDELTDINTPYGKVEILFQSFVGAGGVISSEGIIQNDIISMISNFTKTGNILLSTYGPKGEVLVEGDCSQLSTKELIALFEVASDVVSSFIEVISAMNPAKEMTQNEKAEKVKSKAKG